MNKKILVSMFLFFLILPSVFAVMTGGYFMLEGYPFYAEIELGDSVSFYAVAYSQDDPIWGNVRLESIDVNYSYILDEFDESDGTYGAELEINSTIYGDQCGTFHIIVTGYEATHQHSIVRELNIECPNTAPTFTGEIPNQIIYDGGEFADISLTDYFSDVDENDELTFSANNNALDIEFNNGVAIITYNNFIGTENITFTATDIAGEYVNSNVVSFTVNEVAPEDNILYFANNFDNIEMYDNAEVAINLYANTVYTDVNNNSLNLSTLDYSIQDSTCDGIVYFEIDGEELTVSSINVFDSCYFEILVEETVYSNEMQSDNSNSITINVVPEPQLFVDNIDCLFDQVPQSGTQACQISLLNNSVVPAVVNGATVELYYLGTNELIGTCTTEGLGTCGVEDFDVPNTLGIYEVYAYAYLAGYINDTDMNPTDTFEVIPNTYNIEDFYVYDENGTFTVDFYRGEPVFVEFTVYENGVQLTNEIVSNVTLYDETSGASVEMTLQDFSNGIYYYELDAIPLSDDFLGGNIVFSYVLNNGEAGQATQPITVHNNVPVWDTIPSQTLEVQETIVIDLAAYASDLEDSDNELIFDVINYSSIVTYDLNESSLEITGLNPGEGEIIISVEDTEGDIREASFNIEVVEITSELIAYFDAPSRTHVGDVVVFDATGSQGNIVEYQWDFGDGSTTNSTVMQAKNIINKQISERDLNSNTNQNINTIREIVEHVYDYSAYMTVALTVFDEEGNYDTFSRVINVDSAGACADGYDNDGDGLIDMEDPGCQLSNGRTEFNFRSGIEQGLVFDAITIWSDTGDDAKPGDNVYVNVKIANNAGKDVEDLRLSLMNTDIGMKIKSYQFDLDKDDEKTIKMTFELPQNMPNGEYPLRVSVANDDLIHSNYWFFYVEN